MREPLTEPTIIRACLAVKLLVLSTVLHLSPAELLTLFSRL